jgi:hypothetical protein
MKPTSALLICFATAFAGGVFLTPLRAEDAPRQTESQTDAAPPATVPLPRLRPAVPSETNSEQRFVVVPLKNVVADEVAKALQSMFADGSVQISPDPRTNSLAITAPSKLVEKVIEVAADMDAADRTVASIKVFTLKHRDPAQVGAAVQKAFKNQAKEWQLRTSTDVRTNSLIVIGTDEATKSAEALVWVLDAPPLDAPKGDAEKSALTVESFALQYIHAPDAAEAIRNLTSGLAMELGAKGVLVQVVAEPTTNQILIRGIPAFFEQVRALLTLLDKPPRAEMQIKIFNLKRTRAAAVRDSLSALFPVVIATYAVDERSNALIVRSPDEKLLQEFEAIALRLDQEESHKLDRAASNPAQPPNPEEFRERDRAAAARAAAYRKVLAEFNGSDERAVRAREELRSAVSAAYDARKELQQAEVAALRQRLHAIEQHITARDAIRDQIIDSRVEELLHPERQWETGGTRNSNPAAPQYQSAFSQAAPAASNGSESREPALRPGIQQIRQRLGEELANEEVKAEMKRVEIRVQRAELERFKATPTVSDKEVERAISDRRSVVRARLEAYESELEVLKSGSIADSKQITELENRVQELKSQMEVIRKGVRASLINVAIGAKQASLSQAESELAAQEDRIAALKAHIAERTERESVNGQ